MIIKEKLKLKKKALFKIIKDYVLQMQNANNADEMDAEGVGDYIADEVVFEDINENKNQSISKKFTKLKLIIIVFDSIYGPILSAIHPDNGSRMSAFSRFLFP